MISDWRIPLLAKAAYKPITFMIMFDIAPIEVRMWITFYASLLWITISSDKKK